MYQSVSSCFGTCISVYGLFSLLLLNSNHALTKKLQRLMAAAKDSILAARRERKVEAEIGSGDMGNETPVSLSLSLSFCRSYRVTDRPTFSPWDVCERLAVLSSRTEECTRENHSDMQGGENAFDATVNTAQQAHTGARYSV